MDDRTDWLVKRKQTLGASEIGSVLGVSKWASPYDVWLSKTTDEIFDRSTMATKLGHYLQPAIAKVYCDDNDAQIVAEEKFVTHPNNPWASATLDYLIQEPNTDGLTIMEIKATSEFNWGELPPAYKLQLLWQCYVMGHDRAILVALHSSTAIKTYEFNMADNPWWPDVVEECRKFWFDHVQAKKPPNGVPNEDLIVQVRSIPGRKCQLSSEDADKLREYLDLKQQAKALQEKMDVVKGSVQSKLFDAELGMYLGEPVVTWKSSASRRIDTARLKRQYPAIYEECSTLSLARRFLVKGKILGFNSDTEE